MSKQLLASRFYGDFLKVRFNPILQVPVLKIRPVKHWGYLRSLFTAMALMACSLGFGQSIFTNPITGSNISASPYTTGQVLATGLSSTGISRGSGLSASSTNNRYNVTGANATSLANAISGNDYFQFSITPNACFEVDFSSFVYNSQISTGSINLALRSSIDSYASDIATTTSTTGATMSLSAAAFQSLTSNVIFRLYIWGASSSGTQFSINDFTFNGTVVSRLNTVSSASGITACANAPIAPITRTTTNATGIGSASGLPPGLLASWSSNTITISGTPTNTGTYNYSIPLTGGCGSVNATGTITVNPGTPAQPGSISGTAVQCPGLTNRVYSVASVPNATSYNWTVPTGWTITSGAGTSTINVTTGSAGQDGNISVTAQNTCGTSIAQTLAVSVNPGTPAQPGTITGTATQCPSLTSQTYSVAPVANATTYNWSVPGGWTITAGAGTTSITVTTGTAGQNGNISVTAQNSCGTSSARTFGVTVSPGTPAQPGTISGTTTQCPGLTNRVYSISAVTNASTYNWSVPTGWTITSGIGTTSINVTTGSAGDNGNISVTAQNSCGTSTPRTLAVTVNPGTPAIPTANAGSGAGCTSFTANWSASANATTYFLDVSTSTTFSSFVSGFNNLNVGNVTSRGITGLTAGTTYYYRVRANNSCGTSLNSSIITFATLPATPAQPGTITGTTTQCPALTSQTYSIAAVPNATTYNWSVPSGWTITAGAGTTSITVTTGSFGQNGNISVTAQNSCGTSTARTIGVTVSPATPAQPGIISGTAAQCPALNNQIYSITAVPNASTYNWSVPTGWTINSGQGTTSINVTTGATGQNGNISVTAQNSCGTSTARTLAVTVSPGTPAQPSGISGVASQCASRTGQIYSILPVPNASTYNWTVPSGWTITAGAGSASITVTTGNGGQNGNISVTAQNSCGTSSARTLAVTVTANPTVNVGPGLAAICQGGVSAALGGSVTSPATGGTWSSSAGGTFTPAATNLNATWTPPVGYSGTATLTLTSSGGACGTATGSKSITVNPLPGSAGAITGLNLVCSGQSGVAYSVPAVTNATSYTWSYSGTGFTASGSTASIFGSFSTSATSGILTVRGVNSCGNGVVSVNFPITVNSSPEAAGTITGSPSVCQGQNGVTFSVPPIPGATSYQWTYSGTGFTASGSTATITANFSPTATAGNLTVRGVNSCGNGVASANFPIALAQLPGTPGTILGPSTVCRGQVGFTFTIPAIANATSYSWVYTGTGITFSGNTSTVTATISNTATSGVLRVRGVSACLNGPFSADFPVTVIDAPVVSISSNYCGNPGFVILTASSGFTNYVWNTGATTSFINADIAGQYTVTVANAAGCMASASVAVATELVTNGKFDLGNTGFSTNYSFRTDLGGVQNEMYPEGTYAIVPNANTVHNLFWGTNRTPSGGPFMVVNGHPALGQAVWSQNNIPVQPNTTYYFSAWGLSVVNGNNAALRFTINGNQVGTIAYLPNGYTSTAGPFNWVRFYGSWNSGFETEADLSIINLNTILGGNDFGLDDISFGTLSPIPLTASPGTPNGTNVCQGSQLVLNANAVGGASPFTYSWTGPNGFSSSDMNPVVTTNATTAVAGTYTVTVTDGFGCSVSSNFNLSVSSLPANRTPVATVPTICVDGNSAINLPLSQTGVSYQLRNEANDAPVGDPIAGTGGTISFPVENLSQTTTYNVLATGSLTQCSVEMTNLATVTVATTPVLSITNQAICSGTVNLTAPAVTAGSTGGGTLSYWTNAAGTVALSNPSTVSASGTYYIRSTVGSCSDIEPVSVSISTSPQVGFSYPGSPYCSIGSDPAAVLNSGAVAGTFSCANAGLIFSNLATGAIDLSASTPGTYTIVNTVSPSGGCPTVSANATVEITQAPLTGFSYPQGEDFCQIYNATNPAPIFAPGAAAGTFQSTFGLNFVSASTGVVNLATSTPGNYAIWNSRPAIGGCAAQSDTVFIDINPYIFAGTVSSSVSDDVICLGETVDLFSQTSAYNSVLLRERFNGTINNWVRANNSVGGTPANATWTLRPNNFSYNSVAHRSNDNTQFYMSNSEAQAGTTTITTLRSPVMNTVGYTSLSMDFFHFFNTTNTTDSAQVQVSLNNSTWTTVATYTTNRGGATSFTNQVINLDAYIGQPIFYVRFRYRATNDRLWAIDNVSLTGNCIKYNYNWVSAPAGFTSTQADPVGVAPPQNSFYVVNATNTFGCSNPASPLPVTVNDLPVLTSSLTPPAVCANELFSYTPSATPSGATVSWTRPVATGITNPAITTPQTGIVSETLVNTTGTDQNVVYNFTLNNNGCSQTVPVTVGIKPVPVVDIGSNLVACNGSPVQLNTTVVNGLNVSSYNWSPATGLNDTQIGDPTATLSSASQSYAVSVTATNGCVGSSNSVTVSNFGFGGTAGLWLGTQNSNWDDCRNWADGRIPDASTNVTIDGNATNNLLINGNQVCNSLFFQSTGNGSRTITLVANSTLTVSGNVSLSKSGGTGAIRLRVMNNASLSCNNLSIAGSAMGAANAIVEKDAVNSSIIVNGSLSLDPGALLDMSDNNNATQDGMLNLKGDFVNNAQASDCNSGNTTIIFNGSSLQTITTPANQMFGKVVMDNSSAGGVRLNNSIRIQDGIDFVNGVIDLNQHVLTLGSASNNATINGSGNNSYILAWDGADNGTVVHHVNSGSASYIFPVGDLMEYTPFTVNLNSASLSNATITAKLYAMAHPNIVSSTNYIGRYWSIEPSGISNPDYSVEYGYAAADIFGSEAFLLPAKYSASTGGWQSCMESGSNAMIGNGNVQAGTNILTWTGLNSFSEFTAIGNGVPLPIELLSFTAEPVGSEVHLTWITATETNNSHFTVERSADGKQFEKVAELPGAGNSNVVLKYNAIDPKPYLGVSYYRLKQTDYNGEFSYSEWAVVNFSNEAPIEITNVYPDPGSGALQIQCTNPVNQDVQVTIFDAGGKLIYNAGQGKVSSNWNGSIPLGTLSRGSYILRVKMGDRLLHRKFIF